jgi:hypothetical protein
MGGVLLLWWRIMTIDSKSRIEAAYETYRLTGDDSLFLFILRGDLPLTTSDRKFLAAVSLEAYPSYLWEEKIKPPPGKPRFSAAANHLSGELVQASELGRAAKKVDAKKANMGKGARAHGAGARILKEVADAEGVNEEQLAARMRLPLRKRYF